MKKILSLLLALVLALTLTGCMNPTPQAPEEPETPGLILVEDDEEPAAPTEDEDVPDAPTEDEEPAAPTEDEDVPDAPTEDGWLDPDGSYTTKDDVALYLHQYGCLPQNFITKKEAEALGWSGGSLEKYAPGKCIGGSHFGNYEGLLPKAKGRKYTECDIDTLGAKSRGAKRIIFSNDGLIFYTDDHYESFSEYTEDGTWK